MRTKTCRYCNEEKPVSSFEVANRVGDKVYRRWKCSTCKAVDQKTRRHSIREWFAAYKQTLYCSDCGYRDYRALEFHHVGHKNFDISNAVCWGSSKATILEEIKLCEVLCANCHKIEHYKNN